MIIKINDVVITRNHGTGPVVGVYEDNIRVITKDEKLVSIPLGDVLCVQAPYGDYRWDVSVDSMPR
jgi:hypothetical protein